MCVWGPLALPPRRPPLSNTIGHHNITMMPSPPLFWCASLVQAGNTALIVASHKGLEAVVKALLAAGCNKDAKDNVSRCLLRTWSFLLLLLLFLSPLSILIHMSLD